MIRVLLPALIAWGFSVMLPGPNFLVTTQQATSRSRRAGLATAAGVSTGAAIWSTSALLGVGALLASSSQALRIGRLVGGVVIVWFGLRLILNTRSSTTQGEAQPESPRSSSRSYRQGILTSLSNPKAAVFFSSLFVAALPADLLVAQKVILILCVIGISMGWYCFVATVMSTAPVRALYDRAANTIDRVAGTLLGLLGLRLATTNH